MWPCKQSQVNRRNSPVNSVTVTLEVAGFFGFTYSGALTYLLLQNGTGSKQFIGHPAQALHARG